MAWNFRTITSSESRRLSNKTLALQSLKKIVNNKGQKDSLQPRSQYHYIYQPVFKICIFLEVLEQFRSMASEHHPALHLALLIPMASVKFVWHSITRTHWPWKNSYIFNINTLLQLQNSYVRNIFSAVHIGLTITKDAWGETERWNSWGVGSLMQ